LELLTGGFRTVLKSSM